MFYRILENSLIFANRIFLERRLCIFSIGNRFKSVLILFLDEIQGKVRRTMPNICFIELVANTLIFYKLTNLSKYKLQCKFTYPKIYLHKHFVSIGSNAKSEFRSVYTPFKRR